MSSRRLMLNVGQKSHLLTENETTVFNQVIDKIRNGRYDPGQYRSLIQEHFKQHPSLKKCNKLEVSRRIKKLLETLQDYLVQNKLEKEKNEEQLIEGIPQKHETEGKHY